MFVANGLFTVQYLLHLSPPTPSPHPPQPRPTHRYTITMALAVAVAGIAAAVSTSTASSYDVVATFRDFQHTAHPDFGTFWGMGETGCVNASLDTAGKPILSGKCDDHFTSQAAFEQWYSVDTPAVTKALKFERNEDNGRICSPLCRQPQLLLPLLFFYRCFCRCVCRRFYRCVCRCFCRCFPVGTAIQRSY